MYRRAIVLAALAVLVVASSGMAGGNRDITLDLGSFSIDTADFVAGGEVNDSITFTSPTFPIPQNAIGLIVRMVETTQDTLLDNDSLLFDVQTKWDHAYDSAWFQVGASTLIDDDGTMNTSGTACRVALGADSVLSFGEIGRVRLYVIAEEATFRAADVSGILPFNAVYKALIRFKLR